MVEFEGTLSNNGQNPDLGKQLGPVKGLIDRIMHPGRKDAVETANAQPSSVQSQLLGDGDLGEALPIPEGNGIEGDNGAPQLDKATKKERARVAEIRRVRPTDIRFILPWLKHSETRTHLSPLDEVKIVPKTYSENMDAAARLAQYYQNRENPHKVTPLVAENFLKEPIGAVTMRWHEDMYIGDRERTAGLERLVVDPKLRREGVGRKLVKKALAIAFSEGEEAPYNGQGALEVRLWVMTKKNGIPVRNYNRVMDFFGSFGFTLVNGDPAAWSEYARQKGLDYEPGEEAFYFALKKEDYHRNQPLEKTSEIV